MANLLPPRPRYQKERALYGYPMLFSFLSLFALRALDHFDVFHFDSLLHTLALQLLVFFLPAIVFAPLICNLLPLFEKLLALLA